jgi:polyisoprenoid-binding protein YceI
MQRPRLTSLAAIAMLVLATATAHAATATYKIDPSHSEVAFKVRHFFTKVPGRFNDFAGTVTYDDKNVAASSVEVTIQTTSIFTNNDRRDNHLRSDDFFSAEKFPEITFQSTKVTPGKDGAFTIDGNLTMKGVTKPVRLDAQSLGLGSVAAGGNSMGTRAGFSASTTIDRKDWGILWNKTLDNGSTMLDDKVAIELNVEAVLQPSESAVNDAKPAPAPSVKKK